MKYIRGLINFSLLLPCIVSPVAASPQNEKPRQDTPSAEKVQEPPADITHREPTSRGDDSVLSREKIIEWDDDWAGTGDLPADLPVEGRSTNGDPGAKPTMRQHESGPMTTPVNPSPDRGRDSSSRGVDSAAWHDPSVHQLRVELDQAIQDLLVAHKTAMPYEQHVAAIRQRLRRIEVLHQQYMAALRGEDRTADDESQMATTKDQGDDFDANSASEWTLSPDPQPTPAVGKDPSTASASTIPSTKQIIPAPTSGIPANGNATRKNSDIQSMDANFDTVPE